MNQNVQDAINEQINKELYSAYLYLSMAAYFEGKNLSGFSHWMKIQAQEETTHAMKMYHFLFERGGKVLLKPIDGPPTDFTSPMAVMEETLNHEKKVTGLIHNLYELALSEKDYALQTFLQWFIDEQVEEESNAQDLIERLKIAGEQGPGLFMLDKELGQRSLEVQGKE